MNISRNDLVEGATSLLARVINNSDGDNFIGRATNSLANLIIDSGSEFLSAGEAELLRSIILKSTKFTTKSVASIILKVWDCCVTTNDGLYMFSRLHHRWIHTGKTGALKVFLLFKKELDNICIPNVDNRELCAKCNRISNVISSPKSEHDVQMEICLQSNKKWQGDTFTERLNLQSDFLCFPNGVLNLKSCKFRNGKPTDMCSLSMRLPYVEYQKRDKDVVQFVRLLKECFPDPIFRRYFIDILTCIMIRKLDHNNIVINLLMRQCMEKLFGNYSTLLWRCVCDFQGDECGFQGDNYYLVNSYLPLRDDSHSVFKAIPFYSGKSDIITPTLYSTEKFDGFGVPFYSEKRDRITPTLYSTEKFDGFGVSYDELLTALKKIRHLGTNSTIRIIHCPFSFGTNKVNKWNDGVHYFFFELSDTDLSVLQWMMVKNILYCDEPPYDPVTFSYDWLVGQCGCESCLKKFMDVWWKRLRFAYLLTNLLKDIQLYVLKFLVLIV